MNSILNEEIPASYVLSWDSIRREIIIKIRRNVATYAAIAGNGKNKEAKRIRERITTLTTETNALGFCRNIASSFGLDNALYSRVLEDEPDFVALRAPIPSISGKAGKRKLYKILASLEILFAQLNNQSVREDIGFAGTPTQVLTLDLSVTKEAGEISGVYSSSIFRKIQSNNAEKHVQSIENAMAQAFSRLQPESGPKLTDFTKMSYLPFSGLFMLGIESTNTVTILGIDPSGAVVSGDNGVSITTRNSTGHIEPLILLAGLAQLSDVVAEEINHRDKKESQKQAT